MVWLTNMAAVSLFRVINMTDVTSCENAQNSPRVLDSKTVGFFLKISKEIGKAWRKSLTRAKRASLSLSVFSLIPDLLFDCSRVLEYAKIRTVLQSTRVPFFARPVGNVLARESAFL